ncbi:MAG: type II toxin-antitoxin system VapC family toxin [Polyangiaceae bacterium]|nr:type II toxin-antitoxin system VapC family toxin [Polyangiaceae bacterium]
MIIPDVNLLVYAYNFAAPLHVPARQWWEDSVNREQPVGLPWAVVFGFIRLVTHPSVLAQPLSGLEALGYVRGWTEQSSVAIVEPGPRHLTIVEGLFRATGVAASLTTDTHLAALAIEHQAELHSNDADFARFPGLRWKNPLR